jgi:hypothetical protein
MAVRQSGSEGRFVDRNEHRADTSVVARCAGRVVPDLLTDWRFAIFQRPCIFPGGARTILSIVFLADAPGES